MNLTCYIIDDERHAIEVLSDHIDRTPGLELAGSTTNPLIGLSKITEAAAPDLTFLDVDMPELSGLSVAGLIADRTKVIFTTAFREYAADAFEKDAVDFLLKPIFYERFLKSVQKARDLIAVREKGAHPMNKYAPILFVKTGLKGQLRSIQISDIIRVAAAWDYIEIFLTSEKVTAYLSLNELLDRLPPSEFSRIHRSHLIAHRTIHTLEYAQVRLKDTDKTVLPIGGTYRKAFQEKMNDQMLISKRDPLH